MCIMLSVFVHACVTFVGPACASQRLLLLGNQWYAQVSCGELARRDDVTCGTVLCY